ncbi:MAG: response regulator [Deltaproteobacteria bacterium]|jgi:CheY-like chemotaxis protein|nr:response regulator [Deltaproteobacteria bacterium]MBT6489742.1 response regulator [Deltaproteobacteria bacterium]
MALTRFNPVPKAKSLETQKQKILYVEDEDTNWEVTQLSLRDKFTLQRAATSAEAFEILNKEKFDLILMDIQLSGSELNGIEITQSLRGLAAGTVPDYGREIDCHGARIIFVTAYSARYTKEELIEAGGDDLITKPVDFTRLSLAISRLLVREAFSKQPQVKKFLEENNLPERRKAVRVAIELNCKVHCDGVTDHACIWDLSLGGARIAFDANKIPDAISIGSLIEVEFITAWGVICADSTVVRIAETETNELGVSFDAMSDESKSILSKWLGTYGSKG